MNLRVLRLFVGGTRPSQSSAEAVEHSQARRDDGVVQCSSCDGKDDIVGWRSHVPFLVVMTVVHL